ncbi:fimbrial biogenesis protein [Actinobacillus equuli]|nr:fimbrial biogenesis protein [Actinobacillus equuli]
MAKNCDEKHVLLRYLAMPIQENDDTLWLAIDDMNNLSACEIFAFIAHKTIEPVLISPDELKYLLNQLSPEQQSVYEETELNYQSPDNLELLNQMTLLFRF